MHYTNKSNRGFTLVELLIVIVVIAILAAISIVAFNGVQQRGRDSARQSDVSNIVKALTAYTADDYDWPADTEAAEEALNDYPTANLSANITERLDGNTPDENNRNSYGYTLCSDDGVATGARITWWSEQEGDTEELVAGRCVDEPVGP